MGKYSEFLYESSYVAGGDVYGYSSLISSISPDSGPSTGSQSFVITGEGLSYEGYDDDWSNSSLDVTKWSDISSGTGSITVASPNLMLSTGSTASSVSGVESIATFSNIQFESKVSIPAVSNYPASSVELYSFDLYIDSSNYARISVIQGISAGTTELECSVVVSGKTVDTWTVDWTTGVSVFRILRFGTSVYFYANGVLVFRSSRFVNTAANIRYYSDNNSATYDVYGTIVVHSLLKTFVAFDNQIVFDPVVVSAYRLRGQTPPSLDAKDQSSAYSGFVDISVVSSNTTTQSNFYEYYFEDNLVVLNSAQFNVKMNIIDDTTVRTPANEEKGLGGGK